MDPNSLYDQGFYATHMSGMSASGKNVLGLIFDLYKPEAVMDAGCGQGAWLAAAESHGATTLQGFDGPWVNSDAMQSEKINFTSANFDQQMPTPPQKFDLAISLEVAEHISGANAQNFVNFLCEASDIVLFGAATAGQGGENHINEQWQTYWIEKFKNNGYECFDIIRPNFWNHPDVEWWYKQNAFLFIGPNATAIDRDAARKLEHPIFDIVHPDHFNKKLKASIMRFCPKFLVRILMAIKYRS